MSKKYQVVYENIKNAILTGAYPDGTKLPAEGELMEQFGVSRQTIRQAMDMLKEENLIKKQRGSASYVHIAPKRLRTKRIAVIGQSFTESVFPAILGGIEAVLSQNGYATMVYTHGDDVMRERQILTNLCNDPVDGIILCPAESGMMCANLELIHRIQRMGTQLIFLGTRYPDMEFEAFPCVTMDDYDGVYNIVMEAIGTEHHCVGGLFFHAFHMLQRVAAVRQATIDSGRYYKNRYFQYLMTPDDNMDKMIREALETTLWECDLLICASGLLLPLLENAIQSMPNTNIKTIVTFDEVEHKPCENIRTIVYKGADAEHGRVCAEKLLRMLDGEKEQSQLFPWVRI